MGWQDAYQNKKCSAEEAVRLVKSGDKIMIGQMHGVSQVLVDALCARKEELENVTVFSSVNLCREPYVLEDMRPHIQYRCGFLSSASRKAFKEGFGRVDYMQMYFVDFPRWITDEWKSSVAFPILTPPDEDGYCSFSMNADYMAAACESADRVIAHINPSTPRTFGAKIHVDQLACVVEVDEPIAEIPMGRPGEIEQQIASHIAPRIPDGACLQLGIGGMPETVLTMLLDRKDLGIHSELISDGVVDLYERGVLTGARKQIDQGKLVATFIVGTKRVHEFIHQNPDVLVLPVDYTNNPYTIAKNDNVVSVNSCLEVDFFGQVSADYVNGSFYSGIGGQVDFVRGANLSKGGQSFIALPSTALDGTVSTIIPRLQGPVTTSRFDVRNIVTEYGVADLFGKTLRERAAALIAIAHPKFRDELTHEAKKAKIF